MKAARLRQLSQNIWSTNAGTQDETEATAPEGTRYNKANDTSLSSGVVLLKHAISLNQFPFVPQEC